MNLPSEGMAGVRFKKGTNESRVPKLSSLCPDDDLREKLALAARNLADKAKDIESLRR